jgi:hypothetical protein
MKSVANQVSPDRRGRTRIELGGVWILLLVLGACGSVTTAENPITASDGAAGHDGAAGGAAGELGAAGHDAGAVELGGGTAGTSGAAGTADAGPREDAPPTLPPKCPGFSHIEACPHAGTFAGKRYDYCYTGCVSTSGAAIATCDNNNGACVPSCGDCVP